MSAYPPLYFNLDFLPPGRVTAPRVVGAAVDGGAALSGVTVSSDISGGGLVAVDYNVIQVGNADPSRLRLLNRLAVALTGGVRAIVVPLLTDFIGPFSGLPGSNLSPWSDSVWSDGSYWANDVAEGFVFGAQAQGAGTISISVIGGTGVLEGGEWFGLNHPTRAQRAYLVTDIDSQTTDGNGNNVYTVGIRPTLRDVVADGAPVTWRRPPCMMRLAPGFAPDVDLEKYWYATPSLKFLEAF